jgi:hypothetical protein
VQTILTFVAQGESEAGRYHVLFNFGKPESAQALQAAIEEHTHKV